MIRNLCRFPGTFVGLSLFLGFWGWVFLPELPSEPHAYPPDEVAELAAERAPFEIPENPPVVVRDVDTEEGESAPWYPKGEAPVLEELVRGGALPPLLDRVGPEPLVLSGVEGIGKYGGTWIHLSISRTDVYPINRGIFHASLLRWSPWGYPIKPYVARDLEIRNGHREFVFHLRKGIRWSDGHPFTAEDILYWWEHEANDAEVSPRPPPWMTVHGAAGEVEKIDDYTVRFRFTEPHGLFREYMAFEGALVTNSPAHYLKQYHPTVGDERKIESKVEALRLPGRHSLYGEVKRWDNPEHPRLWPWVYRSEREMEPFPFVRNPYYFAVDTEGNQLPYLDRILFVNRTRDMAAVAIAGGEVTMDVYHTSFANYTHLMSQREANDYEVYHWNAGGGSRTIIVPNLNRRIDPNDPATRFKHELLNNKTFRQALSLAINREAIIEVEYGGVTVPTQHGPPAGSPYYEPALARAFIEYDPQRANKLLDAIGLTQFDSEGYRTFPDGSRMQFMLHFSALSGEGANVWQAVVEDWSAVGVRAVAREQSLRLYATKMLARLHDFGVWVTGSQMFPMMRPEMHVPTSLMSYQALDYASWYMDGGLRGNGNSTFASSLEPPLGDPIRRALELYDKALTEPDFERQAALVREVFKIEAENLWTIAVSSRPPRSVMVKNGFRNVPRKAVYSWILQSPVNAGHETFYLENSADSPGAIAQIKEEIREAPVFGSEVPSKVSEVDLSSSGGAVLVKLVRTVLFGIVACFVALIGLRHPYVGRRLLIMVPTLIIISVVAFVIIQLPPGDFLTYRIAELEASGQTSDLNSIEEIRETFRFDDPALTRYLQWMGVLWFVTFDERDKGLLQGYMGRSMESMGPVNELIKDRFILTFCISLSSILLTWIIALPVGVYSAVRQYSVGDYIATFLGFVGMSIPGFLFALILMYLSTRYFGISVTGLFSPEYSAQPEWTWGKVVNLMERIWVPVIVIALAGTAGMIRVMRGNLLDELRKPYVTTAMAKGVRPLKLLVKYPVRLALNPFISGIGMLFPHLVSGGAIVAMVLSLPTVGPMLLQGVMSEDLYLAGSLLFLLSALSVLGVLVSDLLLMWIDPRIRMEGGTR